MSEHTWVQENLAGYVAGGLDADEREQLEEHLAECTDCTRILAELRAADRKLEGIFAGDRPSAALEHRSIQRLRQVQGRPGQWWFSGRGKALAAAAALVFLAFTGAGVAALIDEERLGYPGSSQNQLKQLGLSFHVDESSYFGVSRAEMALASKTIKDSSVDEVQDAQTMAQRYRESLGDRLMDATTQQGLNVDQKQLGGVVRNDWYENKEGRYPTQGLGTGTMATYEGRPAAISKDGTSNMLGFQADGFVYSLPPGGIHGRERGKPGQDYFKPGSSNGLETESKGIKGRDGRGFGKSAGFGMGITESDRLGRPPEGETGKVSGNKNGEKTIPDRGYSPPILGNDLHKVLNNLTSNQGGQKAPDQIATRKIIRSGDIDFEVNSFDDAVAVVTRLVSATKGGFIATINSDKLPNGKVRGSVVIRVPPDQLDRLVLDLRKEIGKAGELKGQKIGSQDITKQYTDLESRLRAAKTMEERLLKIIRDGKGEIKDLVMAEKELGVWRTRVEEIEGELRYYGSMVALSTLTVNLTEKDIRTAAAIDERERVQAGIEVEDVDGAYREALKAVTEAEGRITKSELKQQKAGQFSALMHFEVEPEKAGPMRDRLKQLGNMARLEIARVVQAQGGTLTLRDGKTKRGPTQFFVSLYNLANVEPRETQVLRVAAADVRATFVKLREAVAKAKGQVKNAQLNEQDKQNVTGQLEFHVRRTEEGDVQAALDGAGEVMTRQVTRQPENENVTDAKVLFKVDLVPATAIPPRDVVTLTVEVNDVDAALTLLHAQVKEVAGRTVDWKDGQERNGRKTARVVVDVPLNSASGLIEKVKSTGVVRGQFLTKNVQAPDGKLAVARVDVTMSNEVLVPRDEGLKAQVLNGLSFSLRGLSLSVSWLIVGVLFLLPWALLLYAVVWLFRRLWRTEPAPAVATAPASATTPETGT
jgi:hypothetical protein